MDMQTADQLLQIVSIIGLVIAYCLGFIAGVIR